MKNITVSVDEGTYRLARVRAAELDTSVSALVRSYLKRLVNTKIGATTSDALHMEKTTELRRRELDEVIADFAARGVGLRSSDNLTRDELYDDAISSSNALR